MKLTVGDPVKKIHTCDTCETEKKNIRQHNKSKVLPKPNNDLMYNLHSIHASLDPHANAIVETQKIYIEVQVSDKWESSRLSTIFLMSSVTVLMIISLVQ